MKINIKNFNKFKYIKLNEIINQIAFIDTKILEYTELIKIG